MSERDRHELKIAGLLHDCGKVTTPVHVVDKATKLQTLFDRIELDRHALRGREARRWSSSSAGRGSTVGQDGDGESLAAIERECAARLAGIDADRAFLRHCNIGGESMRPSDQERVRQIAARYRWRDADGAAAAFLTDDEIENLTIPRRHADAGRAARHQSPHRRHDPDARGAAVAAAPEARSGIRRGPPRAHGRQGLSARTDARADVAAGALHGHRRHLRGAHGRGPALQEGQDAVRSAAHPRQVQS